MQHVIWCEVSGGVTGHREAPLKDADSNVRYFDDEAEAQQEANRLAAAVASNTRASFRYTVKPA